MYSAIHRSIHGKARDIQVYAFFITGIWNLRFERRDLRKNQGGQETCRYNIKLHILLNYYASPFIVCTEVQ